MNNYIYTNSKMLLNKINLITSKSIQKIKNNKCSKCSKCSKSYNKIYKYKYNLDKITITELDIHQLDKHNIIDINLYEQICKLNIDNYPIQWFLLHSNGLNIIDGLYEIGSNKIYIEKTKNIPNTKITRFSEHSGFIYFKNNQIDKIVVLNDSRVDSKDPLIYMPKNSLEALEVDYLFHTHPKTPYIGSRIKNGIIYEFPSIGDIIHYIEHHNNGKLLGSIIVAPEGIYIIHKNIFDREDVKIDYDLMIEKLEKIFIECYNDSYLKYSIIDYNSLKIKNNVKIPDNYFYKTISTNFDFINIINEQLINYDIYIDYYPRVNLKNNWIFPNIYIPVI